jgi:serine protease Do
MHLPRRSPCLVALLGILCLGNARARAAEPAAKARSSFAAVAEQVNKKLVKVYGSGGFQGLPSYGTGVLISPDGYILTVASHLLDTEDLKVHLYDGRRFHARVIVAEPELDAALIKIDKVEDLPHFAVDQAAKAPLAQAGDWVLAFSNQFHIATRDEPLSVQRGVVAAHSKLHGRRGLYKVPYTGDVYVVDAVTNNPGAGGGVVTTRKGELLGLIGKELKNTLTDTWINYAVPIQVLGGFVEKAKNGEYKPIVRTTPAGGAVGYHGIVLVPNVVERTPPYVEEVVPNSPAAKAGLRPDDLIVFVDGEQVISVEAFRELVGKTPPGTTLKLEVRRGDKLVSAEVKLEQPVTKATPKKP